MTEEISKITSIVQNVLNTISVKATDFFFILIKVLIIFFIGKKLILLLSKLLQKVFDRSKMDTGVAMFLHKTIKVALYVVLTLIIAESFGIKSNSFVAIVGSAGLAIGLAFQGSLANFAGGILILILKPFRVGDYIIAQGYEGTVTGIDIFYTKLTTVDNRSIVLPNGALSNCNLVNVTHEKVRRLDLVLSIDYSENIKKVKDILQALAEKHSMVINEEGHEIQIYVNSFEASSVDMGLRVWCEKDNYWSLKWDLLEQIKYAFDENQIVIPFNQLDVNMKK